MAATQAIEDTRPSLDPLPSGPKESTHSEMFSALGGARALNTMADSIKKDSLGSIAMSVALKSMSHALGGSKVSPAEEATQSTKLTHHESRIPEVEVAKKPAPTPSKALGALDEQDDAAAQDKGKDKGKDNDSSKANKGKGEGDTATEGAGKAVEKTAGGAEKSGLQKFSEGAAMHMMKKHPVVGLVALGGYHAVKKISEHAGNYFKALNKKGNELKPESHKALEETSIQNKMDDHPVDTHSDINGATSDSSLPKPKPEKSTSKKQEDEIDRRMEPMHSAHKEEMGNLEHEIDSTNQKIAADPEVQAAGSQLESTMAESVAQVAGSSDTKVTEGSNAKGKDAASAPSGGNILVQDLAAVEQARKPSNDDNEKKKNDPNHVAKKAMDKMKEQSKGEGQNSIKDGKGSEHQGKAEEAKTQTTKDVTSETDTLSSGVGSGANASAVTGEGGSAELGTGADVAASAEGVEMMAAAAA